MLEHLPVDLDYLVQRETTVGWQIPTRRIENHELVLVIQGEGEVTVTQDRHPVRPGDLAYFYPGLSHSLTVQAEPCMIFYGVHFTLPPNMERLPLAPVQHLAHAPRIQRMFRPLLDVYLQKGYLYRWRQNILLEQIVCEILGSEQRRDTPVNLTRVQRVLAYIHQDPYKPFALQELAARAGVEKTLFLESFRQITGTTPLQYVQRLRMEHARDLLLSSSAGIAEIALQCGYQDAFYFSRCFKKTFGIAPAFFRSQCRL